MQGQLLGTVQRLDLSLCSSIDTSDAKLDYVKAIAPSNDRVAVEAKVTLHANDPMVPAAGLKAHMDAHCTIRAYFDPSLLPVDFWVICDHEAFPSYELHVAGAKIVTPQPRPPRSQRCRGPCPHAIHMGLREIPTGTPQAQGCTPGARLVSRVAMEQTNVDRALAALEEQHADDPERVEVLRRTRRFKSSWLALGEALSEVKRGNTWEKWGYETFEAYAKAELKLRMDTVEKLTGSFLFLHKRAPEVLRRDPIESHLPSYQAIDFLRRAEERNDKSISEGGDHTVSEETMSEVRKKVLDEGVPVATVARLYKDSLFPVSESDKKTKDKKDLKSAATKLKELLAETNAVPRRLASTVADALDELLNELAADKKAA